MELTTLEVEKVLAIEAPRLVNSKELNEALKVLEELIDKGLIDEPSYRLASPAAVPSRLSLFPQAKV